MKRLAAVAGVGIAMCVGAGVASADYRQAGPTLTINPTTVAAGGSVTATVRTDCVDGSTIDFQIEPNGDITAGFCSINSYVGRLTAPRRPRHVRRHRLWCGSGLGGQADRHGRAGRFRGAVAEHRFG